MSVTVMKHFDTLDYVDRSKELGVDENMAKHQARQIEQAIDIAVNTANTDIEDRGLATKHDLKQLELATKHDLKQLELATKNDLKQLELATKNDLKQLELATKNDLKPLELKIGQLELRIEQVSSEIHKSKFEIVIWVAGLLVTSGLIQHFLK